MSTKPERIYVVNELNAAIKNMRKQVEDGIKKYPLTAKIGYHGLRLNVRVSADKETFLLRYKSPVTDKWTTLDVGDYKVKTRPGITLLQAIQEAERCNKLLDEGGVDPRDERRQKLKKSSQNFAVDYLFDIYFKDNNGPQALEENYTYKESSKSEIAGWTKQNAKKNLSSYLRVLKPIWGERDIRTIDAMEVLELYKTYLKTPSSRDPSVMMSWGSLVRLKTIVNGIFKTAVEQKALPYFPLDGILGKVSKASKPKVTPPRASIHPVEKLDDFKEMIQKVYGPKKIRNQLTGEALELQTHLFLRPLNLVTMRWEYINWDKKTITFPRREMKIKHSDFVVPLSEPAYKKLLQIRKIAHEDSPFVFASKQAKTGHITIDGVEKLLRQVGYGEANGQTLHGMRHAAKTYMSDNHIKIISPVVSEMCLHHELPRGERVYDNARRSAQRIEAMQLWSDFIEECKNWN